MFTIKTKVLPIILILCGLWGIPLSASATENGAPTTAMGLYGFGAGMLPPVTEYGTFGVRLADYDSNRVMDGNGDKENNDFSLNVKALTLAYIRMTDKTILGGQYGFGFAAPFFKMDSELEIFAGGMSVFQDEAQVFRQADLLFQPLMVQWHPSENLSINGQFQILVPIGDYDKDRMVSPGLNHWAYSPIISLTYITDSGFEVSSTSELDVSTRNKATGYRNGIEYRNEFAVGQHVGPWTLGVGGYYYDQLTDDSGPGSDDGNRARVLALGPSLQFFRRGLPPVWFHAYKEFDAHNRSEGYNISVRVAMSF
ncbi:transporter [Amphritea atlantica]|uniref:Transporter n=1 Tax=Amphritea atlantica TaxID=355243 RepID=A0ABY5H0M1_9GAMM|nr:transporter [Amphritea atlantica]